LARLSKGYSLRGLSAETGLHYDCIHKIEVQKRIPRPETVYRIARSLGENPAELYVRCLEYSMEKVTNPARRTLRIVAKENETPKQMLARLVHRQLHPFNIFIHRYNTTTAEFLESTKISRATLKNWLDSKNTPTIKTLKKVADGFSMTLDDLLNAIEEWNAEDLSDPVGYIEKNIHRLED